MPARRPRSSSTPATIYQGTNIEQIVAWLIAHDGFGGFHFNDRKYADDDLTLGSIDPYQLFRIFAEILSAGRRSRSCIAFMIDQSHNLKGKMEAMVQTVVTAQELYARAALIDFDAPRRVAGRLPSRRSRRDLPFRVLDGRPSQPSAPGASAAASPPTPSGALADSGYVERVSRERRERNRQSTATYA